MLSLDSQEFQPRDDYKELLTISLIFLGETPPSGIKFYEPGAVTDCRWMMKCIYAMKIYLFRQDTFNPVLFETEANYKFSVCKF